jgi:hypothetical protein
MSQLDRPGIHAPCPQLRPFRSRPAFAALRRARSNCTSGRGRQRRHMDTRAGLSAAGSDGLRIPSRRLRRGDTSLVKPNAAGGKAGGDRHRADRRSPARTSGPRAANTPIGVLYSPASTPSPRFPIGRESPDPAQPAEIIHHHVDIMVTPAGTIEGVQLDQRITTPAMNRQFKRNAAEEP